MYLETDSALLTAYADTAARMLRLPIGEELLPAVVENYRRLIDAANVLYAASGDVDEPAPVFEP